LRRGVIRLGDQIKDIWFRDITSRIPPVSIASYIVYTDGSKYYAKNGSTGMIEYSDTDATKVIQYTVNNAPSGGLVLIKAGTYSITDTIIINKSLRLLGEGFGTVLKVTDNLNGSPYGKEMIAVVDTERVEIAYMSFVGIGTADTNPEAIHLFLTKYGNVHHNYFYNLGGAYGGIDISNSPMSIASDNIIDTVKFGIALSGTWNEYDIVVRNNIIMNAMRGLHCEFPWRSVIEGNMIINFSDRGIHLDGSYNNVGRIIISDNVLYSEKSATGIYLSAGISVYGYAKNILIANNFISTAGYEGIHIDANNENIRIVANTFIGLPNSVNAINISSVSNNIEVLDNLFNGYPYSVTINGNVNNIIVRNNRINTIEGVFVSASGVVNGLIVEGNKFEAQYPYHILGSVSNAVVKRNIGYATENTGVATIPAGSTRVTVSHGLASTPTKFLITPLGQPPGKLWVENITSTSFDIVTDTAPASDLNVSWYAEV
jgi:hypothetical protein